MGSPLSCIPESDQFVDPYADFNQTNCNCSNPDHIWIKYMKYLSYSWVMGAFLCYSVHYVQQFTRICSVLTLTVISIERYLAIGYPMKTLWLNSIGRCKKVILLIWLGAAVLAVPTGFRLNYQVLETPRGLTAYWCMRGFPKQDILGQQQAELTYGLYQFCLLMIIPLATMSFCYARIAKIVFSSSQNAALAQQSRYLVICHPFKAKVYWTRYKCRIIILLSWTVAVILALYEIFTFVIRMLIAVLTIFVICWLPKLVLDLRIAIRSEILDKEAKENKLNGGNRIQPPPQLKDDLLLGNREELSHK